MTPKISIIIPCYNQDQFIDRCLESVINQTFTDWECLLINDGSTDKTKEISEPWVNKDPRFKYFYKENGGLSSARNFGMEKALGNFLFFLDSDDRLSNNKSLEILEDHLNINTEVVVANIYDEFSDGTLQKSKLNFPVLESTTIKDSEVIKAYLEEKISTVAWNKLYKTDFIKKNKLKFTDGLLHEDELWSLQVYLKAENVEIIPDYTYNYYKGNPNSITAKKNLKNYNSLMYNMKKIAEYLETEDKLKKIEPKRLIRLFEKQYYFLKNPTVISDKKLWIEKYKDIQKIYKKSILNTHQKRFVYPANWSYFALSKVYKSSNKKNLNTKIYQKLITF